MPCDRIALHDGRTWGTNRRGAGDRPGFSRTERLFLGLAATAIGVWGWRGVDLDSRRDPEPDTHARVMASGSPGPQRESSAAATPHAADESERGRQLFETSGCSSCHALDQSASIGPTLRGVWGTSQPLADGQSVLFDRAYFEESVLHPEARIVRGYKPAMPSYEGLLSPGDLQALAEYIQSLK